MDLEEFIATTLAQIARGVERAQLDATDSEIGPGAWISPSGTGMPVLQGATLMPMGGGTYGYLQSAHFDVAVTALDKKAKQGEVGVKVLKVVGASIDGTRSTENTSASRVQFMVPIVLPGLQLVDREKLRAQERQNAQQRTKGTHGRNWVMGRP